MKVIITADAKKNLKKLDKSISKRIYNYLESLETLEDPRSKGKALSANLAGLWRYRVGDYRIMCHIEDSELVIFALKIAHRRDIYE